MRTALRAPDQSAINSYYLYQVDGIDIFLHKGLALLGHKVEVDLGGIWRFKWVRVSGLVPLAACSI